MKNNPNAVFSFKYDEKVIQMVFPTLIHISGIGHRLQGGLAEFVKAISDFDEPVTYIVDVGAGVGTWTVPFALFFPEAKILGIEPSSRNYPHLTHNCQSFSNVKTIKFAASSEKGTASIAMPSPAQKNRADLDVNTGLISMYGKSNNHRETVQTDTLDNLVDGRVNWLKIDVEGHEIPVLEGAKEILEKHRPLLQVEMDSKNQKMARCTTLRLVDFILNRNYVVYGGIDNDWIFAPKEKV